MSEWYSTPSHGEGSAAGSGQTTWPDGLPFSLVLERARALDHAALSLLYHRFLPVVYRYALAHVGTDPQAEDVTAETFFAVVEGIASTRAQDELGFAAWVLGIARRKVARHFRSLYRRPDTAPLALPEDAQPLAVADGANPLDVITARESWAEVVAALQLLTEEQRTVVVYRCVLGYSIEEIGRMLDKPANAIRGLQFRALHSLARHLGAAERQVADRQQSDTEPPREGGKGHATGR